MGDADFTPVFEEDNPSVADNIFVAMFTKILNETCPLRRLKRGRTKFLKKPWITHGILNSISRKNELYKYTCNHLSSIFSSLKITGML